MTVSAWRRYWAGLDWVQELFYLVVLATEACMIYPWQALAYGLFEGEGIPLWGLILLLWVPYLIASLLSYAQIRPGNKQALAAGLSLLMALITIRLHIYASYPVWDLAWVAEMVDGLFNIAVRLPLDVFIIVLVYIGWWRGVAMSRHALEVQQVWYHFRLGVIVLLGYFLVTMFGPGGDPATIVFAFFFFGLLSIALARIIDMGGIHQSTMGSRQWVLLLSGSVLGNLALALLVSLIFSRQALLMVLAWVRPLLTLLQKASWYLLAFVIYLLWPLIEWATQWIHQLQNRGFTFDISPLASPLARPQDLLQTRQGLDLARYCRTTMVVLIVIGGLILIAKIISQLTQQQAERREVQRESLWSDQDLAASLKNSLLQGLNQLRALAGQLGGQHRRSAASIRKMYASMVDLASDAGYPRRPAQTPYEYRGALYQAFPGGQDAVDAITEAYVRVHYGQVPGTQAEMGRLLESWERVQALVTPKAKQEA
jgi:hypothetical protein